MPWLFMFRLLIGDVVLLVYVMRALLVKAEQGISRMIHQISGRRHMAAAALARAMALKANSTVNTVPRPTLP